MQRAARKLPLRTAREARKQLITPVPDDPGMLSPGGPFTLIDRKSRARTAGPLALASTATPAQGARAGPAREAREQLITPVPDDPGMLSPGGPFTLIDRKSRARTAGPLALASTATPVQGARAGPARAG